MAPSIATVAVGLDSLWLSTRGELDATVLEALAGAKAQASERKQPIALELAELGQFGGTPLYVRPHGGGGYAYLAYNEWGEFAISAARRHCGIDVGRLSWIGGKFRLACRVDRVGNCEAVLAEVRRIVACSDTHALSGRRQST